ncbi:MAG TPA: hypothetical protein PLZ12_20845, partial [Saprospiraceae bacterium]|nr:hypothetical protein [Saprospiraceae bacterium]
DFGFPIPDFGFPIPDFGFPIPDFGFLISDFGFPISVSSAEPRLWGGKAGWGRLPATSCKPR